MREIDNNTSPPQLACKASVGGSYLVLTQLLCKIFAMQMNVSTQDTKIEVSGLCSYLD